MIRWVAGLARRAGGAVLLLLLLLCGAEVALRLCDLRASQSRISSHTASPLETLTVPSWLAYQELRPVSAVKIPSTDSTVTHAVRINSFGIRGAEPDTPKPPDRYRIMCLGDERLLAVELADEDHLTAQLTEHLQPATKLQVEVWNAGVPGACPLTQYLLLTHRLSAFQPDLVLSFVQADDLVKDQAYRRFARVDRQGRPLACRHATLGRHRQPNLLNSWRQHFCLVDRAIDWAGATWRDKTSFDPDLQTNALPVEFLRLRQDSAVVERTLLPLEFTGRWCRDMHASHAVVLVEFADHANNPDLSLASALQEMAHQQHVPLIRLTSTTDSSQTAAARNWPIDDHQRFAEEIARRLVSEISGPWNSPYFRSEARPIAPVGHETEYAPRRIIQRTQPAERNY